MRSGRVVMAISRNGTVEYTAHLKAGSYVQLVEARVRFTYVYLLPGT